MKKTIALLMALAVAAPFAASAATTQSTNQQGYTGFAQGRQAPVLNDGPSTGYNSNGNR
jgi:ABC-type Fe2+-enterobactin transport system substrate-binding protein